jgi:hypothetical protein
MIKSTSFSYFQASTGALELSFQSKIPWIVHHLNPPIPEVVTNSFCAQSCCTNFRNDVTSILPGNLYYLPKLKDKSFAGCFLGYMHTNREIHITDLNTWMSCPGQDNTNSQCMIGYISNIFAGNTGDHSDIFYPFFLSP